MIADLDSNPDPLHLIGKFSSTSWVPDSVSTGNCDCLTVTELWKFWAKPTTINNIVYRSGKIHLIDTADDAFDVVQSYNTGRCRRYNIVVIIKIFI